MANSKENIKNFIRENYGKVAARQGSPAGCCTSTCCGNTPVNLHAVSARLGYSPEELEQAPASANMGLGCGNPLAFAALKEGEVVLDLGCGGGLDCFLASKRVGESGRVIGVDMTPEMIELARKNAERGGYTNVEFRLGEIEHLPMADNSVDVVISNCVINLSPDKKQVLREAYRVLKPGGRLAVTDVLATAPMPESMRQDLNLISCCIGNAESVEEFRKMLEEVGFKKIRLTPKDNSQDIVKDWAPGQEVEKYVASYLIEAVKE